MKQIGWLISRYLVQAILPYFIFSWLLLSVILFVQQAGRFSDIFFSVNIPATLIWQLTVALVPNVISFTCPMAMLVGTVIGLSKMQGDSELVAIRAAGVGNLQVAVPIVVLGVALSLFAFLVNLEGVPLAAGLVRSVALQSAVKKLESPLEPGVFNTEIAGYTVYVKGGDIETGRWQDIFIYDQGTPGGTSRLITSGKGRIDTTEQLSELVLEDAIVTTLPGSTTNGKLSSESIGEVRLAIKTKRGELIQRLSGKDSAPEELGLGDLSAYARGRDGKERIEAELLWQRRLILSISPLIFCLLGTAMVLRFNRSGHGFGTLLSLAGLVGYYLLAFLGEQLSRTGAIPVIAGGLLPIAGSILAITWFSLSRRIVFFEGWFDAAERLIDRLRTPSDKTQKSNLFVDLTTGLGDFDLLANLIKYFAYTVAFLLVISAIFTAFEMWKFAGTIDGGTLLLLKYLAYLVPFLYLYFAPSAAMVGVLATYVLKSRQNEIVTWISAGQSVYRLLLPCFVLMAVLGIVNWQVQERLAPRANQVQDAVRLQIRKSGVTANSSGRFWVAGNGRIYSFELAGDTRPSTGSRNRQEAGPQLAGDSVASDNEKQIGYYSERAGAAPEPAEVMQDERQIAGIDARARTAGDGANLSWGGAAFFRWAPVRALAVALASDNEKGGAPCEGCVRNIVVYEFAESGSRLQTVYRATSAVWSGGKIRFDGPVEKDSFAEGKLSSETLDSAEIAEAHNPFTEIRTKPSHMTIAEIRSRVASSESDIERRTFAVALEKRYQTLFLPLLIALFTAPFSLSLSRKGKAVTIGYAVGLWLVFTGVTNVFEQMGMNGFLTPVMAVWSPVVIFSMLGVFLLSRVRT